MRVDTGEREDGCLTTDVIAARIGVTRQRVDQILNGALMKLRMALMIEAELGPVRAAPILAGLRGKRPEFWHEALRQVRAARAGA